MTARPFRAPQNRPFFESAVDGFHFPLQSEEDVDRLEQSSRMNQEVRDQYVSLLREAKPPNHDAASIFASLFSDEALLGYNYYGKTNRAKKKKAMRKYIIFTDCMIEAWHSHGVTHENLRLAIVKVIARLNHKLRSRGYRRKNPIHKTQDAEDDDEEVYDSP
ncbi:uncharacterized protein LOC134221539 [Armigeres subalbatus]|uniref:uncharacterized protein LOC134221539 n=1 Tax=Armigeres subalbatus TaxID=124917 RepID=UPI002ED6B93D